ncbi:MULTISPECIES: serine hydrolase domain-containing protein [Paenibacillus]|uniref:serine hydrolase domain-containing protein n=1 Tax=Paenibacillus TaxID=44249 RepID=UPI002FE2DB3B
MKKKSGLAGKIIPKTLLPVLIITAGIYACFPAAGAVSAISATSNPERSGHAEKKGDVSEFKRYLDEQVPLLQKKYGVPGVSIGVLEHGNTAYALQYGFADKTAGRKLDEKSRFQAGSISKSVTAWGILKLAEEGKLSLDDPVSKHLGNRTIPGAKVVSEEVTLRRLLSHTAGLAPHPGYMGVEPGRKLPAPEQSLAGAGLFNDPVKFALAPGKEAAYSGAGYTILQMVIEEVSGQPFEDYMKNRVLHPLGMDSSSFGQEEEDRPFLTKAYGYFGQELPAFRFAERAAAGLTTTAEDLMKLMQASLDTSKSGGTPLGHDVVSPGLVREMQKPVLGENGLGIFSRSLPDGTTLLYHPGDNRGWHAFYGFIPESQNGLVILTNSENGIDLRQDLYHAWIRFETGALPEGATALAQTSSLHQWGAYGLTAALAVYLLLAAWRIRSGRRLFVFNHPKPPFVRLTIRLIVILVPGTLLYLGAYRWSVIGLQSGLKFIVLAVSAWLAGLLIFGFFPKLPAKKAKQD